MKSKERRRKIKLIESVMSNKEISIGCRFYDHKYNRYYVIAYLFDAWWLIKKYDKSLWDQCYVRYIWYSGNQSISQVFNNCENLGHALRYWDFVAWVERRLWGDICAACWSDITTRCIGWGKCKMCWSKTLSENDFVSYCWAYKDKTIWEQPEGTIELLYKIARRFLHDKQERNAKD